MLLFPGNFTYVTFVGLWYPIVMRNLNSDEAVSVLSIKRAPFAFKNCFLKIPYTIVCLIWYSIIKQNFKNISPVTTFGHLFGLLWTGNFGKKDLLRKFHLHVFVWIWHSIIMLYLNLQSMPHSYSKTELSGRIYFKRFKEKIKP